MSMNCDLCEKLIDERSGAWHGNHVVCQACDGMYSDEELNDKLLEKHGMFPDAAPSSLESDEEPSLETVCCDGCGHEYHRHIGDECPNCGHNNHDQLEEKFS